MTEQTNEYQRQIEHLQIAVHSLETMLRARKEIQRQKFERILSMLREVTTVLEVYIKTDKEQS